MSACWPTVLGQHSKSAKFNDFKKNITEIVGAAYSVHFSTFPMPKTIMDCILAHF